MRGVLLERYTGRPIVDPDLREGLRARGLDRVAEFIERSRLMPTLEMAERNPPLYMDVNNAYSGDELGLPNRDFIGEGIIAATDLAVTAGAGNSVNIAAGSAWVLGDTNPALQPNYRVYNDAVVNLGISPDPTNPRRVLVGAQITDQGFAGSGRLWALQAIHGTPAASPALPATPASFLPLADVLVPAAAASSAAYTITDLRSRARVGGGGAIGSGVYRKLTAKQVVNSVAETDLLNGEITIAANAIGASGILRLTAFGDWKQNSGASTDVPRFKLKLGATTLLDTSVFSAAVVGNNAGRAGWRIVVEIANLAAANSQWASLEGRIGYISSGAFNAAFFATGAGITQTVMNSATSADTTHMLGGNSGAVDTTAAQALALTTTLPAANANLDLILKGGLVEIL